MPDFTWLPANEASREDVEAVFATGGSARCRCQALKVEGWIWTDSTQEEREAALVAQTACGSAGPTSGVIGYVDGEPAGWVAVEPARATGGSGTASRPGCARTRISRASGRSPASSSAPVSARVA